MATTTTSRHILIGVTGSVAAIKLPKLVQRLQETSSPYKLEIRIVTTKSALHFFNQSDLQVKCYKDEDEWEWKGIGDPILHIELRKWADLFVIAPMDSNTLAKTANGICDNLLSCIVRAWDTTRPLLFCPAMNTHMWAHPITLSQLNTLESYGYTQIPPVSKTLACGDTGVGAMADVENIVSKVWSVLSQNH